MAAIKELREKIRSLKNTSKITSAMKLVSSAKLKKAQDGWNRSHEYAQALQAIVARLLPHVDPQELTLFKEHRKVQKITVLVLSTDKGLCGSFNSNLLRGVYAKHMADWNELQVEYFVVGKKGSDFLSRRCTTSSFETRPAPSAKVPYAMAAQISHEIATRFLTKKTDRVYLAYNQFHSMVSQEPCILPLLPMTPPGIPKPLPPEPVHEPNAPTVIHQLLTQHLQATLFYAMQSSALGEQAARMTAMDNATRNSQELIQRYTLIMNRARQTAITTELSEIVAGAESLKS